MIQWINVIKAVFYSWTRAEYPGLYIIAGILFAIAACIIGYRVYKVLSAVLFFGIGFLCGFATGAYFGSRTWIRVCIALCIGIIFFCACYFFKNVAVITLSIFFTYVICYYFMTAFLYFNSPLAATLAMFIGICMGYLGYMYSRPVILITSAYAGALIFAIMLTDVFGIKSKWVVLTATIALGSASMWIQGRFTATDE